ncbi:superoxide dismutase [Fe] 1, chloroplastic isoform X1 [Lolium perenne]|uniref:superoxide dismutase [Fe] 1, chloroplastic isoform X1 n=1 Tax=Lolium perenne TaxID=4522 RepID=UPI0021F64B95|nr:superoxide dismutase [Fe] 1, chloroplastic-like isoform X1 [Lolium perenne]
MAFTTPAMVGGAVLSLALSASSTSSSASFLPLRAGGDSRRRRLAIPRRGGARGQSWRRRNLHISHCAGEATAVTEDGSHNAVTDAGADQADDTNGDSTDVPESLNPDDVSSVYWIKQQPLPYPTDALEPYISKETVEQHWGVHQHKHVERLNGMIGGSEWEGMSIGQMMLASFNEGREPPQAPFFHAAQIWNHDFYWRSMKPGGGGKPPERLLKFVNRDFGSYDGMIKQFMDAALTQFGSGWVWLSYKGSKLPHVNSKSPIPSDNYGRLVISKSPNAINPLVWGHSPLLAIDVWEHAYYLDYENRRAEYVSAVLEKLVSWEMVESRLRKAVLRAIERDGRTSMKQRRKEIHVGDASTSGEVRRRPRSQDQQVPSSVTVMPAGEAVPN